jgi:purine nucleoside phosphorylase
MTQAVLGIIGGSGIYDLPRLENVRDEALESPGHAFAPVHHGTIEGLPIVFPHGTIRATGSRRLISTTAPILTC